MKDCSCKGGYMVTEAQFYLPKEKERMIQRSHLLEKLYHGLDYKIALITAMTGNGKSTLLTQWAKKIQCPVSYLSLERQVNRMSTFWQQVIYSLYSIFPNIEKEFVKGVMAEDEMSVDFIPKLTHYLQTHQGQVVLIWDDFHFITNEQLLDSVDYFIKLLPANVHLLMASQTRPRISLSTLRLKGELYELEEQSLRFTKEEISELIYKTISVELSGNLVEWIQYRTEGWIAGIRIYTLLLERYKEQNISLEAELLESITGGHAYIAGYFVEGIFNKIPPEKQL